MTTVDGHSFAVTDAGAVVVWGDIDTDAARVPDLAGASVAAVAATPIATYALKSDGTIAAWGDAGPDVTKLTNVVAISATLPNGRNSTGLALRADGSVAAFRAESKTPARANAGVVAIAASGVLNAGLDHKGAVFFWGLDGQEVAGPPSAMADIVAIAAGGTQGGSAFIGLKKNGSVAVWVYDAVKQQFDLTIPVPAAAQAGVVAVAAGGTAQFAVVKRDGSVTVWRIADPNYPEAFTPPALASDVTAITMSENVMLALKKDGKVVAWSPSLAVSKPVPTKLAAVSATAYGYIGVTQAGELVTSGGSTITPDSAKTQVAHVAYYAGVMGVVKTDGSVVLWNEADGKVRPVTTAGQSEVDAICNPATGLVLKRDGTLMGVSADRILKIANTKAPFAACDKNIAVNTKGEAIEVDEKGNTFLADPDIAMPEWGAQDGTTSGWKEGAASRPVTAISSFADNHLALHASGAANQWQRSELTITSPAVPPEAGERVTAIAAGAKHSLALTTDGSVVAWGDNYYGQLEVPAAAKYGVVAIAAGANHSLALKTDGSLVVWGNTGSGDFQPPQELNLSKAHSPPPMLADGMPYGAYFYEATLRGSDWGEPTIPMLLDFKPGGMGKLTVSARGTSSFTWARNGANRLSLTFPNVLISTGTRLSAYAKEFPIFANMPGKWLLTSTDMALEGRSDTGMSMAIKQGFAFVPDENRPEYLPYNRSQGFTYTLTPLAKTLTPIAAELPGTWTLITQYSSFNGETKTGTQGTLQFNADGTVTRQALGQPPSTATNGNWRITGNALVLSNIDNNPVHSAELYLTQDVGPGYDVVMVEHLGDQDSVGRGTAIKQQDNLVVTEADWLGTWLQLGDYELSYLLASPDHTDRWNFGGWLGQWRFDAGQQLWHRDLYEQNSTVKWQPYCNPVAAVDCTPNYSLTSKTLSINEGDYWSWQSTTYFDKGVPSSKPNYSFTHKRKVAEGTQLGRWLASDSIPNFYKAASSPTEVWCFGQDTHGAPKLLVSNHAQSNYVPDGTGLAINFIGGKAYVTRGVVQTVFELVEQTEQGIKVCEHPLGDTCSEANTFWLLNRPPATLSLQTDGKGYIYYADSATANPTYQFGNQIKLQITPKTGFTIASVTGCGATANGAPVNGVQGYTTAPLTTSCTVSASFH